MGSITFLQLELKDWAVVGATMLGPILAVQAQKAVERFRESSNRKTALFAQLMATRAARISTEHVRALNMIDLVFYGKRLFGTLRRTKSEQVVIDAWKEYLDHLNTGFAEANIALWMASGDELFTNLLYSIALDVGYNFDRVQLKKGVYSPIAHGDFENEQATIRKGIISLLGGQSALNMNVVGIPTVPETTANVQTEI